MEKHTFLVKQIAQKLGFDFCGISKAGFLETEAPLLEKWLNQSKHGKMDYMANHFDKRLDPTKLVPGAKSVISLLLNYYPEKEIGVDSDYIISKYTYNIDYHIVIKEKLFQFLNEIKVQIGEIDGRVFVDSAPVMDKVWAKKSGLGWIGKHSNLINREIGSFFFIAELIVDLELNTDGPITDFCGTCTRCIDACPTDAISEPYVVDGSKCISYLTIELKDNIPTEFSGKMENWIFGCDICQDVCPWNRFSKPTQIEQFKPLEALTNMKTTDWQELTEETFKQLFSKSAIKRTKYEGLKRNISFIKSV
ncbi:MAG: tRNA epoxyqueuosine(34) reductase QueG [Bacteroidetes bacterium]|nr:MAG: tRNA epoxyqueuosine(34) reductase QueG [Bacteroidota bacterium]